VAATAHGIGRPLGRYLLFDAIAKGGMATVHFGRLSGPVGFSRTVAIKRLHPHLATDPEFVTMFLDEARLAARIRHPNVVPTIDVVATDGEVFIVMEYVSGESLVKLWRAHTARNERIPVRFALAIVAGALHGLHAAHEVRDESNTPLGLVHRDVSPQNILVGTDGAARVLDFGVAKARGRMQETGDSGSLKGKIAYMAPEQISGGAVTRQTDIYAAAVVLWELLAGRRLVEGDNDAARAAKILTSVNGGNLEPPSKYAPDIPPALDEIVLRGLAWPPPRRFETAKEMATLLERSGGLVPASELGEWVTQLAAPALGEPAERLQAIEASTSQGKTYPLPGGAASAPIVADTEQTVAAAPPVFVDDSKVHTPGRRRRSVFVLVAAMLTASAVASAYVALRARRPPQSVAAASLSPATASAAVAEASSSGREPSTVDVAASASASTSASASNGAARPPPVKSGAASKTSRPPAPPAPHRPAAPATPQPDCDPPFVIDAENHKVYKRECLK